MAKSFLSVMGLYAYDQTLFDYLTAPNGITKQDIIDDIILKCAELEVVYPRHDTMKYAIGVWCRKNLTAWQKLFDSTQFIYNPIWNKDGTIKETETRNLANSKTASGSNSSETEGSSETTNDNTNTEKVSAFNSTDFENRTKNEQTGGATIDDSASSSGTFSNNESGTDTGTVIREREEKGNIGITTTQQMIREEREIVKFNVVDFITNSFINEFCIQVY